MSLDRTSSRYYFLRCGKTGTCFSSTLRQLRVSGLRFRSLGFALRVLDPHLCPASIRRQVDYVR